MVLGFIGLGKMGSRMVIKLLEGGHEAVVWNRSLEVTEEFEKKIKKVILASETRPGSIQKDSGQARMTIAKTIEELAKSLDKPRIIWIMVPAAAAQEIIDEISKH